MPATIAGSPGAHIHGQLPGQETAPIVLHFERTGRDTGLVAAGTAKNPELAATILANPGNYYVSVHTTACLSGTVRDQLA